VTGDLRGSVAATILSTEGTGNTLILHVQHHWVTESGDTLDFDPATATTTQVAPGLYAIVTYPVHLKGGTGKYAKATGNFTNIGESGLDRRKARTSVLRAGLFLLRKLKKAEPNRESTSSDRLGREIPWAPD